MNVRLVALTAFLAGVPASGAALGAVCAPASACMTCCDGTAYRLVYQTVYEQQQVTAYRIEYDTVCEERTVTTYRPVWETEVRERRYRVARPVTETSCREEQYTVQRPVWETQMRDCSYNRVRYVQETAEREERYTVCRPVWETRYRQEAYTVMRPVQKTCYRTEYCTVNQPVTTYRTVYRDEGCYEDQVVYKPCLPSCRLSCQPGGCVTDPATGVTTYRPPGLYWVQTPRGRCEVRRVWRPNLVAHQVAQTCYVPRMVARKVPYQVTTYCPEQVCRSVPYQVCRMVQQECVRRVPYTVCRPVVERVERQVPVKVCRMVCEQRVRRIPVTTCRMVCEERVEQIPVRTCRMVAEERTIRVPRCVARRVPVTYTRCVPRTVCCRVPMDPCLAPVTYGPGMSMGSDAGYTMGSGCAAGCAPVTVQPPATSGNGGGEPARTGNGREGGDAGVRPSIPPDEQIPEPADIDQPAPNGQEEGSRSPYPIPQSDSPEGSGGQST